MASHANRLRQTRPAHPGNRWLARRIDIRDPQPIALVKTACELIEQMERARITMRLKCNQQSSRVEPAQRAQGGFDLGRVMAIVVEDSIMGIAKKFLLP